MNKGKSALMQDLLPQLRIDVVEGQALDPATLFATPRKELWFEIGFGGGEHLTAQALAHPDIGFIGCEPFENGVASLLDHVAREQIQNVRIFPDDARLVLDALPPASLSRCYILYADPWPKKRHAERRFVGPENMPRLARALKPGAELRLATDVVQLGEWMEEHASASPDFTQTYRGHEAPADWIPTRYEQKGIAAGRVPLYLTYRRK